MPTEDRFGTHIEQVPAGHTARMPMMLCGHRAQGYATRQGGYTYPEDQRPPVCVICQCWRKMRIEPEVFGRYAKCYCGKTESSADATLAFFEFRGKDSNYAKEMCGNCQYHYLAHDKEACKNKVDPRTVYETGECQEFVPRGPAEYDLYYCGCRGWD